MREIKRFIVVFPILLALWLILSGKFDSFHISLGVISSAMVSWFSGDLFTEAVGGRNFPRLAKGFMKYIPWLLLQIFLSAIHVLRLSFHPRMRELIDPQIIRFRSSLRDELALVTFANSITLTPGTITVFVDSDGEFRVHAIDRKCAEALPGEMERRVGAIFGGK